MHVEHQSHHRINLEASSGATVVVHAASGKHHSFPNAESTLRLRRFLNRKDSPPNTRSPMRLTLTAIKPNGWWFTLITEAHACGGLMAMRSTHSPCNRMAYGAAISTSATATC
jgi:hypothetical protein